MSRSVRLVGAALVPAFALPFINGAAAEAAVPKPPTNDNLPSQLDVASPYVPQDTCDPQAKPGVLAFGRLMARHYNEFNYGISRACTSGITEHSEGRALDWMLSASDSHERAIAESVLAWLIAPDAQGRQGAMARRFGIMYIIWDHHIWGTYAMDEGWRDYHGSNPHTDHIHFSFSWDGAMQRTSWWTGKAWTGVSTSPDGPSVPVTPPTSYPVLSEGARGSDVRLAQEVIGVAEDGIFGPATRRALVSWQRAHGVPATGTLDTATWDTMVTLGEIPARGESSATHETISIRLGSRGSDVKDLQRMLKVSVDGVFGPKTDAAVREFQKDKQLKVDGVVDSNVWKALAGQQYTKTGTSREDSSNDGSSSKIPATVRRGSTGPAVEELQRDLDLTVDGIFGPKTDAAVREFQKDKQLKVDGVVDSNVWKALKGQQYTKTATSRKDSSKDGSSKTPATVRRGSTGSAIKKVQRILDLTVDGIFGANTASAVRSFQRSHSLTADGIVGPKTWRALLGQSEATSGSSGGTSSAGEDGSSRSGSSSSKIPATVRRGSTGSAIKKVQRILDLTVDGIFGANTASAVRSFQRSHSLTVDGIVGPNTWRALLKSRRGGGAQSISPTSFVGSGAVATVSTTTEFTPLRSVVLARGARGASVKQVQQAMGGIAIDGTFGTLTENAVRNVQRSSGLRATGVVDEATWGALEAIRYPFLTYRTTVLRPGSSGIAVTSLQRHLGVYVDGIYGPVTEQAVRSLQERNALTRTGYVGAVTWQALEREARLVA